MVKKGGQDKETGVTGLAADDPKQTT